MWEACPEGSYFLESSLCGSAWASGGEQGGISPWILKIFLFSVLKNSYSMQNLSGGYSCKLTFEAITAITFTWLFWTGVTF